MTELVIKEDKMEVIIDGVASSVDTSGLNTLFDLLKHLEKNVVYGNRVITKVVVNEEDLDDGQEIGLGAFPITEIASLAVETSDTAKLAAEALEDALEYLPAIAGVLEEAGRKIREGNVREGLQNTSEALEVIGAFGEVLDGIRGAFRIDYAEVRIDDFSLLDKLNELGLQAKAILDAAKAEDWTLLADQIEYEISPLLYEWMAIIPELVALIPDVRAPKEE
jgi:hypothetical protein